MVTTLVAVCRFYDRASGSDDVNKVGAFVLARQGRSRLITVKSAQPSSRDVAEQIFLHDIA